MYDILSTVSPWVVILILAAVIALLLAMVCWCLHLSRRKEATVCAKLSGIRVLRQAYHARSGGQTTALIYIDISLHRMRNRHSAHQASEGYGFVRRHLLGRVAAHPGSLIAHVDGKNFLILCDVGSESVSDEMRLLSRSLDQYAASLGIVDLPEMAVGYYLVTGSTVPFDEAVYRVRQVCKQAAESGKGFCVYNYEELRRQEQRERLETQIDQAIQENRFYLEFQPFVDLTSRRVIGGEVLARMREEQGSTVMPGQFLQAVESVGSQWKFDCYVFEKCCAWLACQDQRATLRYISCNFSRVSISRPDFAQMVIRTADKYNLPHHLIGIEITEEERQQRGPGAASGQQRQAQHRGQSSEPEVAPASEFRSEADDYRAFPAAGILLAVAEVVDHEHCVDHKPAGQCREDRLPVPRAGLDVVGKPDGDEPEEEDDGHVTQSVIGQGPRPRGVEVGEEDAGGTDGNEFPAAPGQHVVAQGPAEDAESGGTRCDGEGGNSGLHGAEGDIPLGEGAVGPQPVGLVGALEEVPQVVDQIGRALHQHGEREAQQGREPVERSVGPGQRRPHEDQNDGIAQAVGADCHDPGCKGVGLHKFPVFKVMDR